MGLAGSGASLGISNALFEISAIFVLLMLGWLFLPVYIASGVFHLDVNLTNSNFIGLCVLYFCIVHTQLYTNQYICRYSQCPSI